MLDSVREEWRKHVSGCAMYSVVEKLKGVKNALRSMNKGLLMWK